MQNRQSYLTEITNTVKQNYQRFLKILPNHRNLGQMPMRQLQYFADQAICKNFRVTVAFNSETISISGSLTKLSDDRLLIKDMTGNLTKIFYLGELQSIQRFN